MSWVQVACKWCIIAGFLLVRSSLLHLSLCPPCVFSSITTILAHIFDSTISGQSHRVRRTGKRCMVECSLVEIEQKQPLLLLDDQERSHLVQQCVTHTEACGKPVTHSVGPFPAFPCGISHMLLSWATHCPTGAYAYCMFLEQNTFGLNPWPWLFSWHTLVYGLCRTSFLVYVYYICVRVYVCASGKEGQVLHSSCCQGRQTKRAETTERLEMRVAIWGNLTHSPALHHRWRERHTWVISWADTSSWVRMRMQSTHLLGLARTLMYVCVTVYVCEVKIVCIHALAQTCMGAHTHNLAITPIFACLYGGISPLGIE